MTRLRTPIPYIVNYAVARSLECVVNWPEPTDKGAGNKENKQEN